jgi:hypothetical protein
MACGSAVNDSLERLGVSASDPACAGTERVPAAEVPAEVPTEVPVPSSLRGSAPRMGM